MESDQAPTARFRLHSGFLERVAHFAAHAAARRRTPTEDSPGSRAPSVHGSGEFAGRRRYRPGDDLRAFDWEALARGGGELVRLRSNDSSEPWAVVLDASASMAVGDPPKFQLAGELALAVCAVGLEWGCEVRLAAGERFHVLRSRSDLARAAEDLDGFSCAGPEGIEGQAGIGPWLSSPALERARRWIAIGDLFDVEPSIVGRFATARRRLDALCVLADVELSPLSHGQSGASVEWRDPEQPVGLTTQLTGAELARYGTALSQHLSHWRASVARARGVLVIARAGDAFEPHAERWIRGRGR